MRKIIPIAILLIILSAYGYYDLARDSGFRISEKEVHETNVNPPKAYFTKTDNIEDIILTEIKKAEDVKCAFYDLDNQNIIDLLIEKNAVVEIEQDNFIEGFHTGKSSAYMHNKFCILDEEIVITGSLNPTERGINKNNNNLLILHSKYLAQNYLDEFDELFAGEFGKGDTVKNPFIILNNNTIIENRFCPEDSCKKQVLEELENAKESIYFMTFSFTDKDIADKLVEKNNEGLDVRGVAESKRRNMNYEQFHYLNDSLSIKLDDNPYTMHHKVFIIDEKTVIAGSYNPTKSGNERNDENILIITDKKIAKEYMDEFNRLHQ